MEVADRDREGVRGIRGVGAERSAEEVGHHEPHLVLRGRSRPDDRQLHLERGVLVDLGPRPGRREEGDAGRLRHGHERPGVHLVEDPLDGHGVGPPLADRRRERLEHGVEATGDGVGRGCDDGVAGEGGQAVALLLHDPQTHAGEAGIDTHRAQPHKRRTHLRIERLFGSRS